MEFRILYCKPCGYRGRAEELAHKLKTRFGASASIEEGGFGQFDVFLDGDLVASKGGFFKRMLIHGAPPQAAMLAAIERALTDKDGDACAIADRGNDV
jgi:selT/selW/selH-like putative selenoprotein